MSGRKGGYFSLLDAFDKFDDSFLCFVDERHKPFIVLDNIETGSLKTILKWCLEKIDDEDLRDLKIHRIIGRFLIEAKYSFLNWCETSETNDIQELESEIMKLGQKHNIEQIPMISYPSQSTLAKVLDMTKTATGQLEKEDSAYYTYSGLDEPAKIEGKDYGTIMPLRKEITKETKHTILLVKKPDYLGKSQWIVRYNDTLTGIGITDEEWLKKFQAQEEIVLPGDSLVGQLEVIVFYNTQEEIESIEYYVYKIIDVIKKQQSTRGSLL